MSDFLQMSGCCSIDASAATIAPTAASLLILSYASVSMLKNSPVRLSSVLFIVLVLTVFLGATSARADYAATIRWYNTTYGTSQLFEEVNQACALTSAGWPQRPPVGPVSSGGTYLYRCIVRANGTDQQYGEAARALACPYGGAVLSGSYLADSPQCSGTPSCPSGQVWNGSSCVVPEPTLNCGPFGTPNANNTCTCNDESYKRLASNGSQTCELCPIPGYLLGEAPTYFSGQGPTPSTICLEYESSIGGSGCSRETARSIRQGTSYAATAMRWTGKSCTVGSDHPNIGEPDVSPDNPNSPDDCLAAGKGYITTNGQTQCVANGTGQNPVTTTNTRTATNSDGTRTTTTSVTNNYGNTTNTTTTSVTTRPDGQTGTDTNSSTGGPEGDVSGQNGQCGGPGQPACRVTLAGGQGEGDAANLNLPEPSSAFNGEAETGLLGGPLNSFLSTARTKLEEAVLLPDLAAADCSALTLWDGFVLDVCAQVELAREIVAWIFYASALWFGWAQLQRAIDRGAS